ncbi:MAG TPA: hypothetical protein VI278_05445, partial [Nitrososphaeraceae archaeon]
ECLMDRSLDASNINGMANTIYRLNYSDESGYKKYRIRADKWFMENHICSGRSKAIQKSRQHI